MSNSSNSSNFRNQQHECYRFEHRTRKTDIAHVVSFLIGVSVLASTSLFRTGSDSFNAVLVLGLLIFGWTTLYWIHKTYRYIRFRKEQKTAMTVNAGGTEDVSLENVNSRLANVETAHSSESESDRGGSQETVHVRDTSL